MKKILAMIFAAALGLGAWGANAPTITVSGTSVTISNESGAEGWDNASLEMTDKYQGKNFTIPAIGTDLPSGTILKITSVSFAVSTSYTYMPDKLGLSGCTSAQKDTSGSFTGGAGATKSTYSFANTDCLVKVDTATPIRFLNSDGEKYSSFMSFRLGLNAYQFIESIVWGGKAPIIEIQAEIVEGKVGVTETTGFETGSGSGKVYVSGYKNHLKTPGENEKELVLEDGVYEYALSINNANSLQDNDDNGNRRTIFSKVSGSGTLTCSAYSVELNPVVEIYDSSEFTGTITTGANTTKMNVYFGAQGETFDDPRYLYNLLMVNNPASICVSADRTTANNNVVTIPAGKTWTASKLLNFGETVVNGTFAGDVVNSGLLTVNGTVNGTIVLDSATAQLVVASGATAPVPTTTVADSVIQTTTSGSSTIYTVAPVVARIGSTEYTTLAAALADVTKDTPLTWVSESAWPSATPVYVQETAQFYSTIDSGDKVGSYFTVAGYTAGTQQLTVYCRPGATITPNSDHWLLNTSITIYGNNASLASGREPDLGSFFNMTAPRTINIYHLEHAGIWGSVDNGAVITINVENCANVHEVLVQGGNASSVVNTTVSNCTFDKNNGAHMAGVSQDCGGSVTITNCTFANMLCGINIKNDTGDLDITIVDCTFTDCGLSSNADNSGPNVDLGAPIRIGAKEGATSEVTISGATFTYTDANPSKVLDADIVIGDNRAAKDGAGIVTYDVSQTGGDMKVVDAHAKNETPSVTPTALVAANDYTGNNAPPVNLGSVTLWVSGSDKLSFSLGFEYTKYDQEDPEEVEDYYNPVVADTTVATITTIDASAMFDGATALGKIHAVAAGETTIECQIADYDEDYNDILVPARFTVVVRAPDPDAPAVLGYSSVGGYTIGYATEDGDTVATLTAEAEAMGLTVVATGTYSEMTNLKDNHVAKIGNVPYLTLQAALDVAQNGDTVSMIADADEDVNLPALQNVTLDFCGHTVAGQLKGAYNKKIDGFVVKNGTIVGRDSSRWANLQIASGSKNVVVTNMTLTTVRPNVSTAGYAFYNQSGSSILLQDVVADGRFYVGNSGSVIAIESGTYRNTVGAAQAIQNNGVVAAKGGTFYYNPTTPDNLVADGYVAIETTDGENVQCWVIERGPSLATITLADGTETEYWDINEAFGAIEEGCTLTIKPGEYTLAAGTGAAGAYNLPANVTIVGAGDNANDVRISSLNQTSPKGLILSGSGITVSNIYFKAEQNEGSALVIRGSGTVVDCVLDGMNETYHCVSDGMYQGIVNGTLHFLRCSILAERYAINVGETSGEVIIEDCTVKGWSSFGSGVKVTVLNTTFVEGTVTEPDYSSPYNDIRFYDDAFISNCTFNAQMEVNICYESRTGIKLIVDDSTYQGEGALSSIITESATQSSASSSDIANNYVAVGTGIELDENGYITGGLFETVDNALIAPECVTGSNSDGETNVSYPTAVGWLRVTDIVQQPGATETQATYAVTAVVVNDEEETVGVFANQQMIEVCIAAADVASSTLAKYDVNKVLEAAFASAGEDALNVTKVEISVVISAPTSGEGTVSYEVHPEAVVTVTKDATDTTTTIPLSNACLAADASFAFDLEVTGVVEAKGWAKVTHVSADPNYAAEARNLKAFAGDGGKVYVTVTTTHFSTFTVEAGVLPVTFGVRSDNLFGSIKIAGNVASNLYVATLFEGFEADGALRKAQDVVHAMNLTAGTKMYVYDKNADKYDVFEVDANGKWAAALKINVTEMTNTFDTADLTRGVTNGTGVIVGRKNTAETVYVYGQVPKIPIASTTFGAGQTLVSPPYTNGVEYVNLNASTWTGVKATGKKRLKNLAGADYIQFRTAQNKLVKYYYLDGEGWGVVPTQVSQFSELVADKKALIPVGTAFWYYSNAGGAKVEWK